MSSAIGSDCADFPQPTDSFNAQPFFGSYSATGGRDSGGSYDNNYGGGGGSGRTEAARTAAGPAADAGGGGGGTTGGGGGGYNNPNLYEAPPQPAPKIKGPKGNGGTGQ